jgi:anti-sigma factor RsiW
MTAGHDERDDLEQLDEGELDLLAYLDGELEGDRAAAVQSRLRTDRAYAARAKAMQSIGDFLRSDADRIYRSARVDAIVDDVLSKVRGEKPRLAEVVPLSQVAPPTSRLSRTKKNTVIWVAFGGIAAAAAALVLWVGAHDARVSPAPVASTTSQPAETVAVKITPPPPSNPPAPVPESVPTVEVENLEVGSGATVIYTVGEGDEGSSPVVWITGREAM